MTVTAYNLLLLPLDLLALRRAARTRRAEPALPWLLLAAGAAAIVPLLLDASGFHKLRLLSYGIFGHGVLLLVGMALATRRTKPRLAAVLATAAALVALIGLDAFFIEPRWLEVSHVEIRSPKIHRRMRLVVLADIQSDAIGDYERTALKRALAEHPDLVLLTGDYVQIANAERRGRELDALRDVFAAAGIARVPLGAIAVGGNIDEPDWPRAFDGLDQVTVVERTRTLQEGEVVVTALDLDDSFRTRLRVPAVEPFHIVMGHGPDFALGHIAADLLIAGHTHGGQVRLPFLGPPITLSAIPRRWAAGTTDLGSGRTLVVSRGIGMERGPAPRLRFHCRPEVVVIDLVPG